MQAKKLALSRQLRFPGAWGASVGVCGQRQFPTNTEESF